MTILTDVDGVLLSWNFRFHRWMRKKGFAPYHQEAYDLGACYAMDHKEIYAYVREFNASAEMGFLPPMTDAVVQVRTLHEEMGVVFHAITSMGSDPFAGRLREMNLKRLFGESTFERITILDCGADKTSALEEYRGSGLCWLEDHIDNANLGTEMGLHSFLFNRSYNQRPDVKDENFTRVNNWGEFTRIFKQVNK